MSEMFVDGVVAAPAFTAAGEAAPDAGPAGGVSGIDPLTAACSAALDSASTVLLNAEGIAANDEATAGRAGTTNVQNLSQAEQNHATELRDPVGQGCGAGGTWT